MLWFVINLPDSTTLEFKLSASAKGQDLLDAVCERLAIIEQDFFGLEYRGPKSEKFWLNRRNKICRQLTGSQPYRLCLRTKFFVQPHLLVQDSTKHYTFLTCKKNCEEGRLLSAVDDKTKLAAIHAFFLQASIGNYDKPSFLRHATKMNWDPEFTHTVALEYSKLTDLKTASVEYRCLKELSTLEEYSYEYHTVRTDDCFIAQLGVGSGGLRLCDENFTVLKRVRYSALNKAWLENRCFCLGISNDDGSLMEYNFRMPTDEACIQVFRSVTESHAFFGCETVNSNVKNQFTRDFKDSLMSLFSEDSSEKNYTFDVDKTVLEVHDAVRRILYREQHQQQTPEIDPLPSSINENTPSEQTECENIGHLKQTLCTIQKAFRCKVCMDAIIDTVFCPCGHWACCNTCALSMEKCPICRADITLHQKVYMDLPAIPNADLDNTQNNREEMVSLNVSECR